jgi:hypothetical protein
MNWTVISATNNDAILQKCLLGSPGIRSATELILQRNYSSAAAAYNTAIERATTDVILLVHQDAYLPHGWDAALQKALQQMSKKDPRWAVMGVFGIQGSGREVGHLFCTEYMRELGQPFEEPPEVRSLDEVLLVLRKSSGVRLDERLPGYHLYGTDLCLTARQRGLKCYALSAFCVHNTNGYNLLPFDFWKAYLYLRRKWRAELPIVTSCTKITFWCWPMLRWNLARSRDLLLKRHKAGSRVEDPRELYERIVRHA